MKLITVVSMASLMFACQTAWTQNELIINPQILDLGSTRVGESTLPYVIEIQNTTAKEVAGFQIIPLQETEHFSFDSTCKATIDLLDTCTLTVRLRPTAAVGPIIGKIEFSWNGGSQIVTLSGYAGN